jgi:uncharacterized protein (DUF362 family)
MSDYPVAVYRQEPCAYPEAAPYHPPARYPELPFLTETDPANRVYDSVRSAFRLLGYDAERFGTPDWNPLGWLVHPGEMVFLKPNLLRQRHKLRDEWQSVITHGSVVRAVSDYVYRALEGRGAILVGDSPQEDSLWDEIMARTGLASLQDFYRDRLGFAIELLDLRQLHRVEKDGIYVETRQLTGDPRGETFVDLGAESLFAEPACRDKSYYGAYYDWEETKLHHSGGRHEYALSRSPLAADVFISLPKLKTHKKCGLTVNLKGLVGINSRKNWLPHYSFGSPESGGDQFARASLGPRLENWVVRGAKRLLLQDLPWFKRFARTTKQTGYRLFGTTEQVVRSGNWHGNDTVWRMSLDLNRSLLFATPDGSLAGLAPAKRYLSVVDGIVAMEGNGPEAGDARPAGVVIAGANPVAVDTVCARLMGFDPDRIPLLARAYGAHRLPLIQGSPADVRPVSNVAAWARPLGEWRLEDTLRFRPHFGWVGAIEWSEEEEAAARS